MPVTRPGAFALAAALISPAAFAQATTPTPEIAGFIVPYAQGTAEAAHAGIAARRLAEASRQVERSGLMAKRGPSAGCTTTTRYHGSVHRAVYAKSSLTSTTSFRRARS